MPLLALVLSPTRKVIVVLGEFDLAHEWSDFRSHSTRWLNFCRAMVATRALLLVVRAMEASMLVTSPLAILRSPTARSPSVLWRGCWSVNAAGPRVTDPWPNFLRLRLCLYVFYLILCFHLKWTCQ